MSASQRLDNLDEQHWNRLQDILEQFERDCAESFPRDLAAYLPEPSDPLRQAVLEELVRTDLELRWRQKQGVLIEKYIKHYPELSDPAPFGRLVARRVPPSPAVGRQA